MLHSIPANMLTFPSHVCSNICSTYEAAYPFVMRPVAVHSLEQECMHSKGVLHTQYGASDAAPHLDDA